MAQVVLVKGRQYTKKQDFGIEGWALQRTDQVVGGEFYSFFTMIGTKRNIIEADGFVYDVEPATYILIPPGVQTDLHRHVFVREAAGEGYTYLGKGQREERYSDTQNKVFF